MKIYIVNMVCPKTKFFVVRDLEELGIKYRLFEKSEIDFEEDLSFSSLRKVVGVLNRYGLEMVIKENNTLSKIVNSFHHLAENSRITGAGLAH
jgi:hypothetical protein